MTRQNNEGEESVTEIVETKEYYMDSDGSLVYNPDVYKGAQGDVELADTLENYIIDQQDTITTSYLKMGAALHEFESKKLYLAKGMPSFRAWISGPEFAMSYEAAHRLISIVRDLMPVLGDKETLLPVSTMKELLPLLRDGTSREQIQEIYDEVEGMTTSDAKKHIRELRGIEAAKPTTLFRADVQQIGDSKYVKITCTTEDGDYYVVSDNGPLRIKDRDWAKWMSRFGDNFIEYS